MCARVRKPQIVVYSRSDLDSKTYLRLLFLYYCYYCASHGAFKYWWRCDAIETEFFSSYVSRSFSNREQEHSMPAKRAMRRPCASVKWLRLSCSWQMGISRKICLHLFGWASHRSITIVVIIFQTAAAAPNTGSSNSSSSGHPDAMQTPSDKGMPEKRELNMHDRALSKIVENGTVKKRCI